MLGKDNFLVYLLPTKEDYQLEQEMDASEDKEQAKIIYHTIVGL